MCRKFIHLIPCVLVLGSVLMGVAQAADPSLVGWWKLDETSGLTAADSSGNNNNGTLVNLRGDQWVRGINDGGLDFVPPGYVNCGTGSSLNVTADFTIAAWVKLAANTAGNYGGIAGRLLQSGGLYTGFGLVRHSGNAFRLWVGDNTADLAKSAVSSNTTYTDTAWHHVLGLRKDGKNYLYVDGVKQTATTTTPFVPSTDFFHIGRQYSHLDDRYFIGVIDDVQLYNRALTNDEIGALAFAPKARDPDPADGAQGVSMPLLCKWTPGTTGVSHDVYLGTTPTLGQAEFKGRQPYLVYFYPGMLTPGTTYYWRIDEVEADNVTIHTGDVWSFTATPLTAYNPNPRDGAQNVWPAAQLKWGSGMNATQHHLYLGDSFSDVVSGAAGTDKGILTETTRSSGPLAPETTYYWRVDEFDGSTWLKGGNIWSFTTSAGGAGILREYWLAIGSGTAVGDLTNNRLYPDKPTGSEILNTFEGPVDWRDNYGSRLRGWLIPPDSGDYTFWIASDDFSELWLSTDADPANKAQIANVPGYVASRDFDNTGGTGGASQKSAAKTLVKGSPYYIEALMKEGGGGDNIAVAWQGPGISGRQIISSNYVSLAPFAPVRAYGPRPANLAAEVTDTPTLRWKAGGKAAKHEVYFGSDATAVANATTASTGIYRGQQNLGAVGYVPTEVPLQWNTTYYWRIDEVNAVVPEGPWKGNVWSFTTASYIIVDDFEDYTDDVGSRIFQTWRDGWGYSEPAPGYPGNGTGSSVGYTQAPFAEPSIVHGGGQSMPLAYDNTGAAGKTRYSETQREWASPQNWTRNNVKAMTLYFYGAPANAVEQLYVALEDNAGHVKVVNHPDPEAVQGAAWQEWNIELTLFAGVNLDAVKKMYIGLGNRSSPKAGGTGTIFIDDIRVYPSRCVPSMGKPAADLSGNCVVDAADVDILANLWLDSGFQITPVNPGTTGLVAQYPFNGNTNDVVGGHNGTAIASPTYTTGKIGQAILLNGVDQMVDVGAIGISGAAPRTIAGWAKANATPASLADWINIFGFTGPSGNYGHFDIELVNVGARGYGLHVYGWERLIMPMDLEWHHLAASYDGTTTKWYGDGRLVGSDSTLVLATPDNVHMGKRDDNEVYFPGRVDEVYIYSRELSGPEIAWLAGYSSAFSIPEDLQQDDVINFKDFAVLADSWLEQIMWP